MKQARMRMGLEAMLAMPGMGGAMRQILRNARQQKPQAKIIRVERITPGGQHAWCESNFGMIRKPLTSIPEDLLAEFRRAQP